MEYYSDIKRSTFESILIKWMNLEPIIQSEVSQQENDKYHILTHISEKVMAPHSSTLAWKIPWTEEPGRLQSMGSRRVRHNWATSLSLLCIGEGNGNPLQYSCLENPRDRGAWWAVVYGVTQSWARLKWLSSSSSSSSSLIYLQSKGLSGVFSNTTVQKHQFFGT